MDKSTASSAHASRVRAERDPGGGARTAAPDAGSIWQAGGNRQSTRMLGALQPFGSANAGGWLQRKCACGGTCERCSGEEEPALQRMPAAGAEAAAPLRGEAAAPGPVLVEDGVTAAPGQMGRSAFMAAMRTQLTAACNEELAPAGRSANDCPYLHTWLAYYERQPAAHIERAIRAYTGTRATDASGLQDAVVARVRSAVRVWTVTGRVTGIPAGISLGAGMLSAGVEALGAVGRGVGEAVLGGVGEAIGGLFTKSEGAGSGGDAGGAASPAAVRAQLDTGVGLNGGVRSRMESAFGRDFSQVRIHTGSDAARLSHGLNARAFTVGSDVAFASGEYQPGTLVGDALLAHELAHVVQQSSAVHAAGGAGSMAQDHGLEEDADSSAVHAVASLWSGTTEWAADLGKRAVPSLKSGLRLQRCGSGNCPAGYCWQVVGSAAAGSFGCDCQWRCLEVPTSGPVMSDPYASRPWVPTDTRHSYGAVAADLSGDPRFAGHCGCFALENDRGPVCSAPLDVPPSIDVAGVLQPIAEGAGGMRHPEPTTETRERPAIVAPPVPGEHTAPPPETAGGGRAGGTAAPRTGGPGGATPAAPGTARTGAPGRAAPAAPETARADPLTAIARMPPREGAMRMDRADGLSPSEAALIARTRAAFALPEAPTQSDPTIVGVLIPEGGSPIPIHSGRSGGPYGGTQRGGIPRGAGTGADRYSAGHVEGHAAAIMRERGITRAWLLIELAPCPQCGGLRSGADARTPNVSSMLPPGSQLLVIDPGSATYFRSTQ